MNNYWSIFIGAFMGLSAGIAIYRFIEGDYISGIIRCITVGINANTLMRFHNNK